MNNTKKITQGAMLLAIYGAILAIDRMLGGFFNVIVVLIPAVLINVYSAMHNYSDGVYFAIGLAILTFIFAGADFIYITYVPVSIITGLVYSLGVKHNLSSIKLLLISVLSFIVAEFLNAYLILPLLNQPSILMFANQEEASLLIKETSDLFSEYGFVNQDAFAILEANPLSLVRAAIIVTMFVTGFFEGVIIHLLTGFLYLKFKIKTIQKSNILSVKPNKVIAYVSMLSLIGLFASFNFLNINDHYIILSLLSMPAIFGIFYLWFYGYIFVLLYLRVTMGLNVHPIFVIILILLFSSFFVISGFLYAVGPFQKLIVVRKNEEQ